MELGEKFEIKINETVREHTQKEGIKHKHMNLAIREETSQYNVKKYHIDIKKRHRNKHN
jgi:hypothetical protein